MPLPPNRERIYQARRAASIGRLTGNEGWPRGWAETGVAEWEAHADGEGRSRDDASYWDGSEAWIIERRRDGR